MLKSKIDQPFSTVLNLGAPGYLSRSGQVSSGGFITTVATLDNRELKRSDGIVHLSAFGQIYGVDPQSSLTNDLVIVFGDERDLHEEFVLFNQPLPPTDLTYKVDIQFSLWGDAYYGTCTVNFDTGVSFMKPFSIPNCGGNNFTAIRLKTTKLSNSDVQTTLDGFNYLLLN
ncbi:hypothetical protein [Chitinophaga filiformis]|uniref:Uncharacterized protein n=1 Tax=Chitinophaga filiformis TaxID=104663 RepID=A0ABY4I0D3_CHIFI|nr:hypothetical protein [Chitinophaga filiformis]UPK69529.1 hypothetical protein MYF79_31700 [Chitinophaga filiformis]